jgi:retinol-binding protein 3
MNFLASTDALIIDVRRNGGGEAEMVQLICSYLLPGDKPIHLNSFYWREGDRTEEFWTLKDLPGKRYLGKEVYVLTSRGTFSAAEVFTYNLKNLKRATIVGETTGGGAHPGGDVLLGDHFAAFIATGRAINPITKTNWEGTGVKPDVEVDAERALDVAREMALKRLRETLTDADAKEFIEQDLRAEDRLEKFYKERKSR